MITERYINLSPFKEVSIVKTWNIHTLRHMATVIVEKDDFFWYLDDEIEKLYDVSAMPVYIKEDWVNYNKRELTMEVVDAHIKDYVRLMESQWPSPDSWENTLATLKSIKRNLIIGKII